VVGFNTFTHTVGAEKRAGAEKMGEHMIHLEHRKRTHLMLRTAGCLTTMALLYALVPGFWSSSAWSQQSPTLIAPVQTPALPKRYPRPTPATQPSLVKPSALNPTPIGLPVTNPASALGSALVTCDKDAESFGPTSLPGARGEIKLDRCYRGRDHLFCSFNAILSETRLLLENYRKIVDANYPDLGSVDDFCRRTPENLATDLQNAAEFANRFKTVKAEYDARAACANRIQQLLRDVTLPDMTQAPAILKSMVDTIEGDIKEVSAAQGRLAELAEKMSSSQKAIVTIQKVHRTMCMRNQSAKVDAQDRGSAGMPILIMPISIERTAPFSNR
jgi:hypothetical protein